MKRYRKRYGEILLCKSVNAVDKTAGRKRNMSVADVYSLLVTDKAQEFHHVVIVIKRLANSHHNDVGDALSHVLLRRKHLTQQLGWAKITHLAANRRGTECTAHKAADLRGYADGVSMLVSHNNALDRVSVG